MVQASTSGAAVSLAKVDTEYSADCIEWCPFEGFQDIFICGTYQVLEPTKLSDDLSAASSEDQVRKTRDVGDSDDELEEESPKQTQRTGRLLVYQVSSEQTNLKEIQRIDTPAILDARWSPNLAQSGYPELAVADAKGHITIYHFGSDSRQLEEVQSIEVAEDTILCLSLDYSHRLRPTEAPHIITSLSSGHLVHLTPSSDGYEVEQTWKAHDFEPWCVTWDNWDTDIVWSGGDDLKLKRWNIHSTTFPTWLNKDFEAGVTTITSSPHIPHLLAVGSYDASVRLYDTREPKQPLQTIECGGGIWRSRFHPDQARANELLIASMHDGFKVIRIYQSLSPTSKDDTRNESQDANPIIRRFDEHTSLAYGADWSRLPMKNSEDTTLVATCSFYDHTLHLWRG